MHLECTPSEDTFVNDLNGAPTHVHRCVEPQLTSVSRTLYNIPVTIQGVPFGSLKTRSYQIIRMLASAFVYCTNLYI